MLMALVRAARGRVLALCLFGLVGLSSFAARAHTIPGSITLSERVALADVVVVATIVRAALPDGAPHKRPGHLLAQAAVVERVLGEPPAGALLFEPHSHSGETYTEGERVVLFLRKPEAPATAKNAPAAARTDEVYGTVDDVSDRVSLGTAAAERASRADVLAAVRGYARALSASDGAARGAQRKAVTLALLRAADARLQASALRDLAQGSVQIDRADLPALLEIADDPRASMAARVTLLEDLDRRGLVNAASRYESWLATAPLSEMAALARAAGRKNDAAITAALAARLGGPDEESAALAARALGEPFHESAIAALLRAADPGRHKLAVAVVESLGRMGTPAAQQGLSALLARSDDPEWQRSVQTQLNRIAQRAARPGPPGSTASGAGAEPSASLAGAAGAAGAAKEPQSSGVETPAGEVPWTTVVVLGVVAMAGAGLWLRGRAKSLSG
jgi:hypothetical protein